jgi:diguanylate cyclase (GGDEF)-like protein
MTFPPDIGLLLYASSGFAMLIGLVFLVIARRMAQTWLLPHWAAAMLVLGIGSLGYALRPPNPWLSSILPNALFLIALLLFHRGALRVNNVARTFDWLGVSVVVIATGLIAWLNLVVPDLGTRVIVLSVATAFRASRTAIQLSIFAQRKGSPVPANVLASLWWFLVAIMGITSVAMMVHTQHNQDLFQAGPPILTLFHVRPLLIFFGAVFGLIVELRLLATDAPAPIEAEAAASRAAFDAACNAAIAARQGQPLCVVLVDLDDHRQIAKRHGRLAAVAVMKWVGGMIQADLQEGDSLFVHGNDQYALLLPQTDQASALLFANDLCRHIGSGHCTYGKKSISTSVSAGVAGYTPERNTARALAASAKVAIYQARADGRSQAHGATDTWTAQQFGQL